MFEVIAKKLDVVISLYLYFSVVIKLDNII